MPRYVVAWKIDIEAGSPRQAAKQALAIQRDAESTATVFDVRMVGPCPSCKQYQVHKPNCRIVRGPINGPLAVDAQIEIDAAPKEPRSATL